MTKIWPGPGSNSGTASIASGCRELVHHRRLHGLRHSNLRLMLAFSPLVLRADPPAATHVLADDFPDDRQSFPGRFLGEQGGVGDAAHELRDVVVDRLLRPDLAFRAVM